MDKACHHTPWPLGNPKTCMKSIHNCIISKHKSFIIRLLPRKIGCFLERQADANHRGLVSSTMDEAFANQCKKLSVNSAESNTMDIGDLNSEVSTEQISLVLIGRVIMQGTVSILKLLRKPWRKLGESWSGYSSDLFALISSLFISYTGEIRRKSWRVGHGASITSYLCWTRS